MHTISRRDCLKSGLASLGAASLPGFHPPAVRESSFHYDHVLGTSLDGWLLAANSNAAARGESAALGEFERLRKIFSLYDPQSELSRLNRMPGAAAISPDIQTVLHEYEIWQQRSGGACNATMGALVQLWTEADRRSVLPDAGSIAMTLRSICQQRWRLDPARGLVIRDAAEPFNLNSVAKGFIIGRALAVLQKAGPNLMGGLINLGGDIACWGDRSWPVAIQNPKEPTENSRPLGIVHLRNASIATSGGYQRFYTIGDKRFSHLLDPRTGWPAEGVASATVLAPDSVTANILATTLCVLAPQEGLRLVGSVPGAQCLIVASNGQMIQSAGLELRPADLPQREKVSESACTVDDKDKGDQWPDGFQVAVSLEIPNIEAARKYRRPYVAIWIEDSAGKQVRTLTVWGNKPKWIGELTDWWKIGKSDSELFKTVTRATRGPGKYEVVWDGKDGKGDLVSQGIYTIRVEAHREHGNHVRQTGKIECKGAPSKIALEKKAEIGDTVVEYRKKQS
jgi:FAD:protein FMN transferase